MVCINIRLKLNNQLQIIVDKVNGKPADIMLAIGHFLIVAGVVYSLYTFSMLTMNPIRENMNSSILVFLIFLCLVSLYASQMGDFFKEPSRKIFLYAWIVTSLSVFSLTYLAITFNEIFVDVIAKIKNIEVIPPDMLVGNIRVVSSLLPLAIILPVLYISLITLKDRKNKELIREFEFESLLPTVHKMDDTTIDIEIGKDYRTGLPLVVPEKMLYEHMWLQGGTGSGKSSNAIIPYEEQLLKKKSYLTHKLKEIASDCLKDDIAYINKPVTNKWFNENFNMDYISPKLGREEEFYKAFEKYTIGVIKRDEFVTKEEFKKSVTKVVQGLRSSDYTYQVSVDVLIDNIVHDTLRFSIEKGHELQQIATKYCAISTSLESANSETNASIDTDTGEVTVTLDEGTSYIEINITRNDLMHKSANAQLSESTNVHMNNKTNEDINDSVNKDMNNKTNKDIHNSANEELNKETYDDMNFVMRVMLKGNGRLVPKNLGMTVVAPDGELISKTVEMANQYGIKVHKIDPDRTEIDKGNVAAFNPLMGDSPEKIGDIIASILVSMDSNGSDKSNPYFTNASVRAIRNLVILLKITYPKMENRQPTLLDVLQHLNNMNDVKRLTDFVLADAKLHEKYETVIDYFITSFIDTEKSEDGKYYSAGSQKKETQRALGGIINQLDNLLGRDEIRNILCNYKDSLDLAQVLRNGECIAISTRQGNLGSRLGKAFALFFILSMQNEVLSRYAENENPEIPHFLIIDEFPMYCNDNTETFFTFARKYKCSVTIAIQNMGQLKKVSDEFGETIFTNTSTKILMSKSNLEDRKYWSDFFGSSMEMEYMTGVSTNSVFADNPNYSEQVRGQLGEVKNVTEDDVDNLKFKQMLFSYTNAKGRKTIGKGTTDFVNVSPEDYMNRQYDFERYAITRDEYSKILDREKALVEKEEQKNELNKSNNMASVNSEVFEEETTNTTSRPIVQQREDAGETNDTTEEITEKRETGSIEDALKKSIPVFNPAKLTVTNSEGIDFDELKLKQPSKSTIPSETTNNDLECQEEEKSETCEEKTADTKEDKKEDTQDNQSSDEPVIKFNLSEEL